MHQKATRSGGAFHSFLDSVGTPEIAGVLAPHVFTLQGFPYTGRLTGRAGKLWHLENFRFPNSGFRKFGGSIITTAGESKDPPGNSNAASEASVLVSSR